MYIKRRVEQLLLLALKQFPACLITGPRQAGKSTLLQNALQSYAYVTLDDPFSRRMANEDPELFLSRYPAPLIIDEIQYAPGLLPYLKIQIDQQRRKYGQFVLTGSQSFQLMKGVSETLAGRISLFQLYPLSWQEIETIPDHERDTEDDTTTLNTIVQGFYPEFFIHATLSKELWFSSYLSTYIERDVRNIKSITDLNRFQTFVSLLATRAGQLLNMSEIAKECGITQPTAKDWISILESTYIIYLLKPYHQNRSKRLVKSPKLFFVDTGLLCYLLGIDSGERLFKAADRGHVFENMIIMECMKRLSYQTSRTQCFFYRTAAGDEIDLVLEQGTALHAYEIKMAKTLSKEMASSLIKFKRDTPLKSATLLSLHQETTPLAPEITACHWSRASF